MGMFDSVYVACPHCGKPVEHQSKEGECYLNRYSLEDAPSEILFDIMNDPVHCESCGNWMALIDPRYPPGERPKPNLRAAKVKAPENPITHPQGMKWWPHDDKRFTYEDLAP